MKKPLLWLNRRRKSRRRKSIGASERNVPKAAVLNASKSRQTVSLGGLVAYVRVFFIYTAGIGVADAGTLSVHIVPNLYVSSRMDYTHPSLLS